jgi:TPR repeat protein
MCCKKFCDCWYGLLPGAVNYCIGTSIGENGSCRRGLRLFEPAAGCGDKHAQYTLGVIYLKGDHVAQDRARGIAWLMLANERHNDAQTDFVKRSAVNLATPEQNKRAQRLFQEMRQEYGDEVAGARAWRQLKTHLNGPAFSAQNSCLVEDGSAAPWSHGMAADPHLLCMPTGPAAKSLAKIASAYFDGLTWTVTVGPLQQVPGPESSCTP